MGLSSATMATHTEHKKIVFYRYIILKLIAVDIGIIILSIRFKSTGLSKLSCYRNICYKMGSIYIQTGTKGQGSLELVDETRMLHPK